MPARMTPEQEQEILDAHEAWDPAVESIEALAARLGVGKQSIYNTLERNGRKPKSRRAGALDEDVIDLRPDQAAGFSNTDGSPVAQNSSTFGEVEFLTPTKPMSRTDFRSVLFFTFPQLSQNSPVPVCS